MPPSEPYIWRLPNEAPGTLAEIFDAEDSRRQNLVLYEIRRADGFRRCSEAVGTKVDPYHLIHAVVRCVALHLRPTKRLADYRDELREVANRAEAAAVALERLSAAIDRKGRLGWNARLELSGLPDHDPTNPRTIVDLRKMATGLKAIIAKGAFRDKGGRTKLLAFKYLIKELAHVFEGATERRPTVTWNDYRSEYSGDFFNFVEIVRPIVYNMLEKSGITMEQPKNTNAALGKFIQDQLMEKTSAG